MTKHSLKDKKIKKANWKTEMGDYAKQIVEMQNTLTIASHDHCDNRNLVSCLGDLCSYEMKLPTLN